MVHSAMGGPGGRLFAVGDRVLGRRPAGEGRAGHPARGTRTGLRAQELLDGPDVGAGPVRRAPPSETGTMEATDESNRIEGFAP